MSQVVGLPSNSYKPITNTAWVRASFVNYKEGALDSQSQVITVTSCLPMVGGSHRVLRLLPPLKLVPKQRCIHHSNACCQTVHHNVGCRTPKSEVILSRFKVQLLLVALVIPMITGSGWLSELVSRITQQLIQAYHQYAWVRASFVNYKKGALDSQSQVIKVTSCWPMVGGSHRVFWLLPPLKLVAMIQLKYC